MKHLIIILIALFTFQAPVEVHIFEKVKRKVIRKKDRKENETIDEGIDTVEDIFKKNR